MSESILPVAMIGDDMFVIFLILWSSCRSVDVMGFLDGLGLVVYLGIASHICPGLSWLKTSKRHLLNTCLMVPSKNNNIALWCDNALYRQNVESNSASFVRKFARVTEQSYPKYQIVTRLLGLILY